MLPTPKKPPSSTTDLISAIRNTRQASILLREVTRLRCEDAFKKIRAVPAIGGHKDKSQG